LAKGLMTEEQFSFRLNIQDGCKVYSKRIVVVFLSEVERVVLEFDDSQPISFEV
jgi:hypothetical protein